MKLVLFGAGNIGRGFIAPVFAHGGYEVVFVDIDPVVIGALNDRHEYTVVAVHPNGVREETVVSGVRAIDSGDTESVSREIGSADLLATSVGARALPGVMQKIANALDARRRSGNALDIILAENAPDAPGMAAGILSRESGSPHNVGIVETSIGKMVPLIPQEVRDQDPLIVYAEPYNTLIVDQKGFRGAIPDIADLKPVNPIKAWVQRKLFIHNLGHAAVAYCGNRYDLSLELIAEAVTIPSVREVARDAMTACAVALNLEYPGVFGKGDLEHHIDDLLDRFGNPALGDTIHRVGRDLTRKLGRNERIIGSIRMATRLGVNSIPLAEVFAASIEFQKPDETGVFLASDENLKRRIKQQPGTVFHEVCGLDPADPVDQGVMNLLRPCIGA